jgi:hypothetical protein
MSALSTRIDRHTAGRVRARARGQTADDANVASHAGGGCGGCAGCPWRRSLAGSLAGWLARSLAAARSVVPLGTAALALVYVAIYREEVAAKHFVSLAGLLLGAGMWAYEGAWGGGGGGMHLAR